MPDPYSLFQWLATLSIGLMSITIPTYAICVVFVGRESKRTVMESESREERLRQKLNELSRPGQSRQLLDALKEEITQCEADLKRLKARSGSLSVKAAFLEPFVSFVVSLLLNAYASVTWPEEPFSWPALGVAVALLSYGAYKLGRTLFAIEEAALSPTKIASLRVSFMSESTVERFKPSEEREVSFVIRNFGKQMAEKVLFQLYFPDSFVISEGKDYDALVQPRTADIPGSIGVAFNMKEIHENVNAVFQPVKLKVPSKPGIYRVPVCVWEKELGASEQELTFEVASP